MDALSKVTFTGVDERSDLARIAALSAAHPHVEWGFLYSPKRQGEPGRYPSISFLAHALSALPPHCNVALHVCGAGVPGLLGGEPVISELVERVARRSGRLQLNFNQQDGRVDLWKLFSFIARAHPMQVITQFNENNAGVAKALESCPNHAMLFDASGGRGQQPSIWPLPLSNTPCGYAGGLGPSTIESALPKILQVSKGAVTAPWIDMENSLRRIDELGVDWLELSRCEEVLDAVGRVLTVREPEMAM